MAVSPYGPRACGRRQLVAESGNWFPPRGAASLEAAEFLFGVGVPRSL